MDIKQKWDELHSEARFCPIYPHDRVVAWVFRNFPRGMAKQFQMLDLGCGAGRHALFMAHEGYLVSASDFSAAGLAETQRRATEAGVKIATVLCGADRLEFSDNSFDGVVCFGVAYYLGYTDLLAAIAEIHRVLKPGGKALVITRSTADLRCDARHRIGPCTYRVPDLNEHAPSNVETGMIMTFLERQDIEPAFAAFRELAVERLTMTSGNGAFVDDDWYIQVVK